MLRHFKINIKPIVRKDTMAGRDYLVAPMIMIKEGIANGASGPSLYTRTEIKKSAPTWNMKPVVVYHPKINGVGVTACDPAVLTNQQVGIIMNATMEGDKLKAEAWLDEERCNAVDERILTAIANEQMMELSTGLFSDEEPTSGEWEGRRYESVLRNIQPDHLALLPDQIGACSIADGAGFLRLNSKRVEERIGTIFAADFFPLLKRAGIDTDKLVRNELSHDAIRTAIYSKLQATLTDETYMTTWVEDVFDDFFIYEKSGALWKQAYKEADSVVSFEGLPEEVTRVIEYRTSSSVFVANKQMKGAKMDKKKIVQSLIDNKMTVWAEADRDFLMGQEDDVLVKFTPIENTVVPVIPEAPVVPEVIVKNRAPKTVEEVLAEPALAPFRDMLTTGLAAHNAMKIKLVEKIAANERSTFTPEQLNVMSVNQLAQIVNVMGVKEESTSQNFLGAGIEPKDITINVDEEPLELPVMEFATA
ncbi:MAG TPA: DUF2213 domain-containing protein [Desulfosporosinus sp.]|nr:DUF2213 domain-containing protein [Desulfosporosinus sp.]